MAIRASLGLILTALLVGAAALHVQGAWSTLPHVDIDRIRGLLLDYSGELAFFWLAFGYLWLVSGYYQQRAELRNAALLARRAIEQAELATRMVESQARKFEQYQAIQVRAAQPHWEIQGFIAHREQHDINLRNVGAAASRMRVISDQKLPLAIVLSNPVLVDRGQPLMIKVLCRERVERFELVLEYCDALGEQRRAYIAVSEMTVTIRHDEQKDAAVKLEQPLEEAHANVSAA